LSACTYAGLSCKKTAQWKASHIMGEQLYKASRVMAP
jgi:hypothetical protein